MTISSERISELKELAGKATPGKRLLGDSNYIYDENGRPICMVELGRDDDAELIAAIDPSTLLALLEEVEGLRAAAGPFAKLGQYMIDEGFTKKPDDATMWGFDCNELTYGDFRRIANIIGKATP